MCIRYREMQRQHETRDDRVPLSYTCTLAQPKRAYGDVYMMVYRYTRSVEIVSGFPHLHAAEDCDVAEKPITFS